MSLSDRIAVMTLALVTSKDVLVQAQKDYSEKPDDDATFASLEKAIGDVESTEKQLAVLKRSEAALMGNLNQGTPGAPAIIKRDKPEANPIDLIFKSALVAYEVGVSNRSLEDVVQKRFGDDQNLISVLPLMVSKAAQNPAMTNVAGYAQELTQQAYGAFLNLLMPESVIPRIPMDSHQFDGYNSIYIPARSGSHTGTPNFAGAFRAEGAPARVGGLSLTSKTLTPKQLSVIGTMTEEILRRSTPSIMNVIRNAIIEDTAVALDGVYLGTAAGSTTQPAGIANALGAYTNASTGVTADALYADLTKMLKLQYSALMGKNPRWVMSPGTAISIGGTLNAIGQPQFPGMTNIQGAKTLFGIAVVESTNIADTRVLLIDGPQLSWSGGVPSFDTSNVATLHEEGATPLPIATGVQGSGVIATPARSLFQTFSVALRMNMPVDWAIMRPNGSVVELTGVTFP